MTTSDNTRTSIFETDNSVTIGKTRIEVAVEAVCEIEQLSAVLVSEISKLNLVDCYAIRGMIGRTKELSRIVLSAIGDSMENIDDLAYQLRLERTVSN